MKSKALAEMAPILKQMDLGMSYSLADIKEKTGLSARTIQTTMNNLISFVTGTDIFRESKTYKARPGFIRESGINAEKMLLISTILSNEDRFGAEMTDDLKDMMNTLKRDAMLLLDRNETMERVTPQMWTTINQINNAIEYQSSISFEFDGYIRHVQPLSVISREYYWYLVGHEDSKHPTSPGKEGSSTHKMKTYTISKIKRLWVMDDPISYDFTFAKTLLPHVSNGYVTWDKEPVEVQVLVEKSIDRHIENARFYHSWKKVAASAIVEGYNLYKVMSVHENFLDIIPTVTKHMPDMIVLHPERLVHLIFETTKQHQAATDFIHELANEKVNKKEEQTL